MICSSSKDLTCSLYGSPLYILFRPTLNVFIILSTMKLVVASQNIFLGSAGVYGCHEELSFLIGGVFVAPISSCVSAKL